MLTLFLITHFLHLSSQPLRPSIPATSPAPTPPALWRKSWPPRPMATAGSSCTSTGTGSCLNRSCTAWRRSATRPSSSPSTCPTRGSAATTSATSSSCPPIWRSRTLMGCSRYAREAPIPSSHGDRRAMCVLYCKMVKHMLLKSHAIAQKQKYTSGLASSVLTNLSRTHRGWCWGTGQTY